MKSVLDKDKFVIRDKSKSIEIYVVRYDKDDRQLTRCVYISRYVNKRATHSHHIHMVTELLCIEI